MAQHHASADLPSDAALPARLDRDITRRLTVWLAAICLAAAALELASAAGGVAVVDGLWSKLAAVALWIGVAGGFSTALNGALFGSRSMSPALRSHRQVVAGRLPLVRLHGSFPIAILICAALPGGFAWQTGGSLPVQLFQMLVVATCLAHRPPAGARLGVLVRGPQQPPRISGGGGVRRRPIPA